MEAELNVLAECVEAEIKKICEEQSQADLSSYARKLLFDIGERAALQILNRISAQRITKSFSGYVVTLVKKYHPSAITMTPTKRTQSPSAVALHTSPLRNCPKQARHRLPFEDQSSSTSELNGMTTISAQMQILNALEFKKLFLLLTYTGSQKLETVVSVDEAKELINMNSWEMKEFEAEIWNKYGNKYCVLTDRCEFMAWEPGKTYHYYLTIHEDGSYHFKGPCLNRTRTHLQRSLGDDNILIVKFLDVNTSVAENIAKKGILVGLRRFWFFAFKDARNRPKKNPLEKEKSPCVLKCYFACLGSINPYDKEGSSNFSGKGVSQARSLFMHVHTVETMEKYMARFSLILSTTMKLQVDLNTVKITTIEDIPFRDESGCPKCDEDGKVLIHTDGTGYISEDLAMKCPEDFSSAKYIKGSTFEKFEGLVGSNDMSSLTRSENVNNEPPLLMQCRLFYNGLAVKGTLLLNKKLKKQEIQIRPSMIKVERDFSLPVGKNFNSLEIVAVSHKPGRTFLSKNLISLLNYGGVPRQVFLDLLSKALKNSQKIYSNKRAALRVASNHDMLDYGFMAQQMISSGIPLNEPYLHHCLWNLKKADKTNLRKGKIPISESFYLMGTADPTGVLNYDQVCVVLENGQMCGKVLVYRNPGLHFGDIHVMEAVYVKELEEFIGDSKYGIFFCTKGCKSAPYEMATGDFDGDMYWVSRHPQLLKSFTASEAWERKHPSPPMGSNCKGPQDFAAPHELEEELFRLFLKARKPSFEMPMAADSWLAFMDRLLTLGDDRAMEKLALKDRMSHLIEIYYDAIDAPKSGKQIDFSDDLRPSLYPHHMGKGPEYSYHSTSILGQIYDTIEAYNDEDKPNTDVCKLACFEIAIPDEYIEKWKTNHEEYRRDMAAALNTGDESKNDAANDVIKKYKKKLYDAGEMEESTKDTQEIYKEALAIYHVTYDYAKSVDNCGKCYFAWNVAGSALCSLYAWKKATPKEKPISILPSVLREILN